MQHPGFQDNYERNPAQSKLTQAKPMKHDLSRNESAQSVMAYKMIQREVRPQQYDANKFLKKMLLTDKHSTLSTLTLFGRY